MAKKDRDFEVTITKLSPAKYTFPITAADEKEAGEMCLELVESGQLSIEENEWDYSEAGNHEFRVESVVPAGVKECREVVEETFKGPVDKPLDAVVKTRDLDGLAVLGFEMEEGTEEEFQAFPNLMVDLDARGNEGRFRKVDFDPEHLLVIYKQLPPHQRDLIPRRPDVRPH